MIPSLRGLRSRLAALALALAFGAAGAHSSGTSSPTGAACSADAAAAHAAGLPHASAVGLGSRAATGAGWKRAETERIGTAPEGGGTCRVLLEASAHPFHARSPSGERRGLPARRSNGLLGLGTSPANAPPGS